MKHFIGLLLLIPLLGLEGEKLVKTRISDNISIMLPKDFKPMNEFDQQDRMYSYRKAMAVYTSPDRLVEFGANRSFTQWAASDIELAQDFYKSTILSLYDEVEFITNEVQTIDGRKFAVFEFVGEVRDGYRTDFVVSKKVLKKYVYIQYTIYQKNSLVFNFTSPALRKGQWQATARKIMHSIKIK